MKLNRQRATLVGIFALFMGPLLLVVLMRSAWWNYQPEASSNHGQLLRPAVQLPLPKRPDVQGKWLLLRIVPQSCDRNCIADIIALRQIHKASGRQRQRLAVVLLSRDVPEPKLKARLVSIDAQFKFISSPPANTLETLAGINSVKVSANSSGKEFDTFILDPMHHIILAYNADDNPGDINKDLQHLLKWSR